MESKRMTMHLRRKKKKKHKKNSENKMEVKTRYPKKKNKKNNAVQKQKEKVLQLSRRANARVIFYFSLPTLAPYLPCRIGLILEGI